MEVKVTRSRRKTVVLKINKDASINLLVPLSFPEKEINRFLLSKENWIKRKVSLIQENIAKTKELNTFDSFILLGKKYNTLLNNKNNIELRDDYVLLPKFKDEKQAFRMIKKFLIGECRALLIPIVQEIGKQIGLSTQKIEIINSKRKWGSMDTNKRMCLNFKIICLPEKIIRYIVIHEYAHMIEMNHSATFWKAVEKLEPSYKSARAILKEYSYILNAYQK